MMSPNMLLVTITSNGRGSRTICSAKRVHVHVLGRDLRIFAADFFEYPLPQAAGISHDVGFVRHQHAFARAAILFFVALAVVKGVTDNAFHAFASVDVLLHRDFVGRSLLEAAARIHIHAFGVLADDHEVDIFGLDTLERTKRRIQQAHRTHVGVEIHFEAHAQQDFFGMDIRRDARIAKGAHQDGIKIAGQHGESVRRDGDAVGEIAFRAPVEMRQLHRGLSAVITLTASGMTSLPMPSPGMMAIRFFWLTRRKR